MLTTSKLSCKNNLLLWYFCVVLFLYSIVIGYTQLKNHKKIGFARKSRNEKSRRPHFHLPKKKHWWRNTKCTSRGELNVLLEMAYYQKGFWFQNLFWLCFDTVLIVSSITIISTQFWWCFRCFTWTYLHLKCSTS
jgi:hypothetical protein